MTRILILLALTLTLGCASAQITPPEEPGEEPTVKATSFGTGDATITYPLADGREVTIEVGTDGASLAGVVNGLVGAAARVFGGGGENKLVIIKDGEVELPEVGDE